MSIADEIQKLHELRSNGALNEAEFVRAKAIVLGQIAPPESIVVQHDSLADGKNWLRTLARSTKDRCLGGVCGGLGEQTPIPSWGWRFLFCLTTVFYGLGLVAYVLMWIFVPQSPAAIPTSSALGSAEF